MNNLIKLLIVSVCFSEVFAIAPPKKGVKVPQYLLEEFRHIRNDYTTGYWAQEISRRIKMREVANWEFSLRQQQKDTIKIPILMGYYADANPRYSKESMQMNLYDGPNPTGTITDYYLENSYGQMYITGKVSDWVALPNNMSYYIKDMNSSRDFVIDLLILIDEKFDFSPFVDVNSLDAEGYHVRFLGVIHSGAGAEAGANNIWSHRWNISSRLYERRNESALAGRCTPLNHFVTNDKYNGYPVVIDGDYACQPELSGNSNFSGPIIEIGVFCHEFGHIFGLPDLYDTDNSSEGVGNWCLMAGGSWGGDGRSPRLPSHMSAWCKIQMSWITPIVVQSYLPRKQIRQVETYPEVIKMWKQGLAGSQYFLVENRQKVGFDLNLPESGLLIYHVDDSQPDNNDENHYKVDLEQADGLRHLNMGINRGDSGDPFPGSNNNRRFDGFTEPSSKDYSNAQTYVGVRNISSSGEIMYADLDVGLRPYLQVIGVKQIDRGQFSENGRIEPGESGKLEIQLKNIHPTNADNASLEVKGDGEDIVIDAAVTPFSIEAFSSKNILTTSNISLDKNFIPREIPLKFVVKAENFEEEYQYTLTFGYPSLLILDGDSIPNISVKYIRNALDSIPKFYEIQRVDINLSNDAFLFNRSIVIFFSGNKKYQTINDVVLDSLVNFINSGGRLLISGQNIAEDLQMRGVSALNNVFHIRWSKNQLIGRLVYGVTGNVLGGSIRKLAISGGDGASNQTSPDVLFTDNISVPFLTYGNGTTSIAGAYVEDGVKNSKLVFLGFGIESINNEFSETKSTDFLNKILNWFEAPNDIAKVEYVVPSCYKLGVAYPNPFNPITSFQYEVSEKSRVQIILYNIIGQKVATIVSEEKLPGRYNALINGINLTSGTYFYVMDAGKFHQTQRIVLIK